MPAQSHTPSPNTGENRHVFINCPFDPKYKPVFEAIVFAVHDCGFVARSALEFSDSSTTRIDKIVDLIAKCRFGIHDLSRTELDRKYRLPRFNMPLELGIFLGAQKLGTAAHRDKRYLILDREKYRYQRFISDIAGQDIHAHGNHPERAIRAVRTWLSDQRIEGTLPGANALWARYQRFKSRLPAYCQSVQLDIDELTFNDYTRLVARWLADDPRTD